MTLRHVRHLVFAFLFSCTSPLAMADLQMKTIAEGLDTPWSITELPDQGFLVTERPGGLKYVSVSGDVIPVTGVPEVFAQLCETFSLLDLSGSKRVPEGMW